MYLIVGLGNPEPEYSKTRHNMGFDSINKIASENDIKLNKTKFEGIYGVGEIKSQKVILLKPQTYMNESGRSIIKFLNFFKIELCNCIVILDDIELDIGKIRIRSKGSASSHNGLKSVVNHLQTENFARIRIGIGKPINKDNLIDYVITKVSKNEYKDLEEGIEKAKEATYCILEKNIDVAMNKYN